MSTCTITESFVAAVSGHPQWWSDDRRHYCAYCGVKTRSWVTSKDGPAPADAFTRDHIIPRSLGGVIQVPSCITCNQAKKDVSLEEFMKRRRFRIVRAKPNKNMWPLEDLWLAHSAAALQICFRAKAAGGQMPAVVAA